MSKRSILLTGALGAAIAVGPLAAQTAAPAAKAKVATDFSHPLIGLPPT